MIKKYLSIVTILLVCSAANASELRRVVTGLDANDKSTTLFDSVMTLEVAKSGSPGAILWTTDSYPLGFSSEDAGKRPVAIAPPPNGTVIRVVDFQPIDDATVAKMDPTLLMKVVGDNAPARGVPVTNPLMHRTRTVDYAIIMSGEIDMMLDDRRCTLGLGTSQSSRRTTTLG